MTRSGATTPGQNGPGSDGNKGVLCIPQSSSIAEVSLSDCLVSYPLQRYSWYILQPHQEKKPYEYVEVIIE